MSVLCGYFFTLNKISIVKKENISSFLLSKMYEINFHYQHLARVRSTKRKQFVWTWKGIPNNRYCPGNWIKYKIVQNLSFYAFTLILNQLFRLKSLWITFGMTLREHPTMAASASMFYITLKYISCFLNSGFLVSVDHYTAENLRGLERNLLLNNV